MGAVMSAIRFAEELKQEATRKIVESNRLHRNHATDNGLGPDRANDLSPTIS